MARHAVADAKIKGLERWKAELSDFQSHGLKDCGRFLAEEDHGELPT